LCPMTGCHERRALKTREEMFRISTSLGVKEAFKGGEMSLSCSVLSFAVRLDDHVSSYRLQPFRRSRCISIYITGTAPAGRAI